jgi:hypothetical protein
VDGVIEGSVQRDNGRVKVMIQLVHGPTDTHLWARDYERALTDVLKLQGEMARAIADEVRSKSGRKSEPECPRPPPSIQPPIKSICSDAITSGSSSSTTTSGP